MPPCNLSPERHKYPFPLARSPPLLSPRHQFSLKKHPTPQIRNHIFQPRYTTYPFNYTTKMLLLKPIENKPTTTTPTVTLAQPLNPLYAPRPAAKGKCAVHLCSACHKIFVPVEGGMCIACECSWSWNVRGGGTNCDIGQLGA